MRLKSALLALALLLPTVSSAAAEKGKLGITVSASFTKSILPTIIRVSVTSVAPGSAAEQAGLSVGDEILELDGKPVPGAKAFSLISLRNIKHGQRLVFKLKRGAIVLAAVPVVAQ